MFLVPLQKMFQHLMILEPDFRHSTIRSFVRYVETSDISIGTDAVSHPREHSPDCSSPLNIGISLRSDWRTTFNRLSPPDVQRSSREDEYGPVGIFVPSLPLGLPSSVYLSDRPIIQPMFIHPIDKSRRPIDILERGFKFIFLSSRFDPRNIIQESQSLPYGIENLTERIIVRVEGSNIVFRFGSTEEFATRSVRNGKPDRFAHIFQRKDFIGVEFPLGLLHTSRYFVVAFAVYDGEEFFDGLLVIVLDGDFLDWDWRW
jgi:hypothetical protein